MLTYSDYLNAIENLKDKIPFKPEIGCILGSGLGDFVNEIEVKNIIKYSDIPFLPKTTNKAHKGQYVFGYYKNIPLVLMQGRIHLYEGYASDLTIAPVRLMAMMGIKKAIVTNAAGGVNLSFTKGDIMLIIDHISSFIKSPLIGENISEFGERFPDMSEPYNLEVTNKIYQLAKKYNLPMQKGVYLQFYGPQFETRTEIQMARFLKADAVGMSTCNEVIILNHMKINTIGFSLISNMACGIEQNKLSDDDVIETGKNAKENLTKVFKLAIEELNKYDR